MLTISTTQQVDYPIMDDVNVLTGTVGGVPIAVLEWQRHSKDVAFYRYNTEEMSQELLLVGQQPPLGMVGLSISPEDALGRDEQVFRCSSLDVTCQKCMVRYHDERIIESRSGNCVQKENPYYVIPYAERIAVKYETPKIAAHSLRGYFNDVLYFPPIDVQVLRPEGTPFYDNEEGDNVTIKLWFPGRSQAYSIGEAVGHQVVELACTKLPDGGWKVDDFTSDRHRLNSKSCMNCGFINTGESFERVMFGFHSCKHSVCEECVKIVYTREISDKDAFEYDEDEHFPDEVCRVLSCRQKMSDTLRSPFKGLFEVSAPKPITYLGYRAVYSVNLKRHVSFMYRSIFKKIVMAYAAINIADANIAQWSSFAHRLGEVTQAKIQNFQLCMAGLETWLNRKQEYFGFLLSDQIQLPDNFIERNSLFYLHVLDLGEFDRVADKFKLAWEAYCQAVRQCAEIRVMQSVSDRQNLYESATQNMRLFGM